MRGEKPIWRGFEGEIKKYLETFGKDIKE